MVAEDSVIVPAPTPEITGGMGLFTVTETLLLAPVIPAALHATAASVCGPLARPAVFHGTLYEGPDPVTGEARSAPSSLNCTLVTDTAPVALAVTATVPNTVAPACGTVTETAGGVVSVAIKKEADFFTVPSVAEMMSQPLRLLSVVKVKVPLVEPPAMVRDVGTCCPALVDARLITEASEIALARVIVQLPEVPGMITVGRHAMVESTAGTASEMTCVLETAPTAAVITADWLVATAPAVALNVALIAPAGMVTDAGTVSAAAELLSVTETAEVAAAVRATVQTLA